MSDPLPLPPGVRNSLAMPVPGSEDWHRALTARITLYEGEEGQFTAIIGVILNGRSINRIVKGHFASPAVAYAQASAELTKLYAEVAHNWPAKAKEAGQ